MQDINMIKKELPKNWQIKTLVELCDEIFAGGDVPKNNFSKIKTEDFKIPIYANGEKNLGLYGYTNLSKVNSPALTISGRGTIGFSVVRKVPFFPIVRLLVLIPNSEIDIQFLKYSIDNCNIKHTGSSIPQLTVPSIKGIKISFPNFETQQAIVSKIEELFSELDRGIADLKTAQAQLKVYRQSVLKHAFEGKLTNKNVKEGELPEGWRIEQLKKISSSIQYGYTESSSKEIIGPKFLRITDIQNNYVDWNEVPYCKITPENTEKYRLKDGDLVFARTGATVGKSFLIKGEIPDSVFASYLIRVRVSEKINDKYLSYFFNSPQYWEQITEGQVGIGQPNVNGTKLGLLNILLTSLEEQYLIVQEIEIRLSVADKMEESIQESLQKAEALRQSILKKAFSGELV